MAYKVYEKKSEVAHHTGKTLGVNIPTAFQRFLTLLTTLGAFQAIEQLLKLGNIKIVVSGTLAGRSGGHVFKLLTVLIILDTSTRN